MKSMSLEKRQIVEGALQSAYKSGFLNAASSLSMMTKHNIDYNGLMMGHHKLDVDCFTEKISFKLNGSSVLVTTEVCGDVPGKSYLFLSEKEFELLTGSIPAGQGIDLKEEFIKELDNILSASVITKLANELKYKMFGDVPVFVGKVNGKIEDIIYDDFSEQTEDIYISSAQFSFANHPTMRPFFVWVIDAGAINVVA